MCSAWGNWGIWGSENFRAYLLWWTAHLEAPLRVSLWPNGLLLFPASTKSRSDAITVGPPHTRLFTLCSVFGYYPKAGVDTEGLFCWGVTWQICVFYDQLAQWVNRGERKKNRAIRVTRITGAKGKKVTWPRYVVSWVLTGNSFQKQLCPGSADLESTSKCSEASDLRRQQ